ncbi:Thiamine kinase [Acaryochloris thomasi RCC1774]|uniref:Thiamine kinase n=1 Tax=Acaryochloris thomasi RCC1774 TaxID=1764569 RepID=A0A2W1J9F1_9CYAN|nr:aminoglycoside phosphotransferase family protein [Acaryochloris thomasi]PZD70696.1 Thiamine kinase [Acaryochloris thomasi RCC1774]
MNILHLKRYRKSASRRVKSWLRMGRHLQDPVRTSSSAFQIDLALVHSLLEGQHPDLAHLQICHLGTGWHNTMFRLGDQLLLRLPRRTTAGPLIENEQIWLPQLADRLPINVPTAVRVGEPTQRYPWRWSILPWLTGTTAEQVNLRTSQVQHFTSFLKALHVPAPANAPQNPVRGVPLKQRSAVFEKRFLRVEEQTNLITRQIKNIWHRAIEAPMDGEPRWLHGDLHPLNVVVNDGAISGIIDWGHITSGDIATDLASIWMLFAQQNHRQQVIESYGNLSDATLQRAQGWAILFGVGLVESGLVANSSHASIGAATLQRVAEDSLALR